MNTLYDGPAYREKFRDAVPLLNFLEQLRNYLLLQITLSEVHLSIRHLGSCWRWNLELGAMKIRYYKEVIEPEVQRLVVRHGYSKHYLDTFGDATCIRVLIIKVDNTTMWNLYWSSPWVHIDVKLGSAWSDVFRKTIVKHRTELFVRKTEKLV